MSWLSSAFRGITHLATGVVGSALSVVTGGMLEKPKMPAVVMPQVPSVDDEVVKAQLAKAAQNVRRRVIGLGRGSTILTSSAGLTGAAPVFRKTLLGE